MPDLGTWLLVLSAWTIEVSVALLVWRTRKLVLRLLAIAEPWLADGDPTEPMGEVPKVAVRDKRGRIVRWVKVPQGAGYPRGPADEGGGGGPPQPGLMEQGVPVQELLAKYEQGTLTKADLIPHVPAIFAHLKREFSPRQGAGGGGGGGYTEGRPRYG